MKEQEKEKQKMEEENQKKGNAEREGEQKRHEECAEKQKRKEEADSRGESTFLANCSNDTNYMIELTNGKKYDDIDCIISATGVRPNVPSEWREIFATSSDGGIIVDQFMTTSVPDIYAAGDVCTVDWNCIRSSGQSGHGDDGQMDGKLNMVTLDIGSK